tara:strand:+ start:317 stop:931 length:615 start_codon:yes stop_codon:yes gene_type:complete
VLTAHEITCIRGQRALFTGLNLTIDAGEILHIEGSNGSGKTSLLRILCGTTQPDSGTVLWRSQDIRTCRSTYYEHLAYVGHSNGIKLELSPAENLSCLAAVKGFAIDFQIDEVLAQIGLSPVRDVPCIHLSAGQRRRVAMSWLFITRASIWILDEPLTAIDQDGINLARFRFSRHLDNGGLIVLTGHQHLQFDGRKIKTLHLSA